jgi:ketosteroid isomerase-like protein
MAPDSANTEVVQRLFACLRSGDREAVIEMATPETELHTRISALSGEPYKGVEGVRQWFADVDQQFSAFELDPEELRDLGDGQVLVTGEVEVRGRGSELPWHEQVSYLFEVRDEKILKLRMFTEQEEAEAAARGDG